MKRMKKILALTTAIALMTSQLQAQETCADDCSAYVDSGKASYMAALLPIGALLVAAVIIATTDSGHHHHGSSSSSHSHHRHHHHSHSNSSSSSSSSSH